MQVQVCNLDGVMDALFREFLSQPGERQYCSQLLRSIRKGERLEGKDLLCVPSSSGGRNASPRSSPHGSPHNPALLSPLFLPHSPRSPHAPNGPFSNGAVSVMRTPTSSQTRFSRSSLTSGGSLPVSPPLARAVFRAAPVPSASSACSTPVARSIGPAFDRLEESNISGSKAAEGLDRAGVEVTPAPFVRLEGSSLPASSVRGPQVSSESSSTPTFRNFDAKETCVDTINSNHKLISDTPAEAWMSNIKVVATEDADSRIPKGHIPVPTTNNNNVAVTSVESTSRNSSNNSDSVPPAIPLCDIDKNVIQALIKTKCMMEDDPCQQKLHPINSGSKVASLGDLVQKHTADCNLASQIPPIQLFNCNIEETDVDSPKNIDKIVEILSNNKCDTVSSDVSDLGIKNVVDNNNVVYEPCQSDIMCDPISDPSLKQSDKKQKSCKSVSSRIAKFNSLVQDNSALSSSNSTHKNRLMESNEGPSSSVRDHHPLDYCDASIRSTKEIPYCDKENVDAFHPPVKKGNLIQSSLRQLGLQEPTDEVAADQADGKCFSKVPLITKGVLPDHRLVGSISSKHSSLANPGSPPKSTPVNESQLKPKNVQALLPACEALNQRCSDEVVLRRHVDRHPRHHSPSSPSSVESHKRPHPLDVEKTILDESSLLCDPLNSGFICSSEIPANSPNGSPSSERFSDEACASDNKLANAKNRAVSARGGAGMCRSLRNAVLQDCAVFASTSAVQKRHPKRWVSSYTIYCS